jgi:hypothetical protein
MLYRRDVMLSVPLSRKVAACIILAAISLSAIDCFAIKCEHRCTPGGCPAPCEYCCPTMEEVTEEKSCWNVECETVCIPAFRFPWEPGGSKLTLFSWLDKRDDCCRCAGCTTSAARVGREDSTCNCQCTRPPCGAVRYARVLEKETFEVTTSKCKWEIVEGVRCRMLDASSGN